MAQITLNLADGSTITVPEWALETTQQDVLKEIGKLVKTTGGTTAAQEKATTDAKKLLTLAQKEAKETKSANKEQEKRDDKQYKLDQEHKASLDSLSDEMKKFKADKNKSNFDKIIDDFEETGEQVGRSLLYMGEKAVAGGLAIATSLIGGLTYVSHALLGAGDTLNQLSDVGVGMNSTFAGVAQNATAGIAGLAGLTGSFGAAADLIKNSSSVVATQGFGRFTDSMKFASDVSEELGMSFEDSMDKFGDALSRRQNSMNLQNVGQGALNRTIQTTIKSQRTYSMALGISSEHLEAFVDSLTRNNGLLNSTLLGMNDSIRNDVMGGIEVFASGMAGLGGQAGEGIAQAFTEAASAGAIGLSDEAVGYITALPSLAGPMNEYISAVQNGTLSQSQAQDMVGDLTMSLGNLSQGEKARVKSLAAIGDQNAQALANAITQFEQSEDKMKELNKQLGTAFDMDTVQKGTNEFNKVLNQAKGGFSNMFYSLFSNPEITKALSDGMNDILEIFGFTTDSVGSKAMDMSKTIEKFVPIVKSVVQGMVNVFKDVAEFFAKYINADGMDFGGLISAMLGKALKGIVKSLLYAIPTFILAIFAVGYAKSIFASVLLPKMTSFMDGLFAGAGKTAGSLAERTKGWLGKMFKGDPSQLTKGGMRDMRFTANKDFASSKMGRIQEAAGKLKNKVMPVDGKIAGVAGRLKAGIAGKFGGGADGAAGVLKDVENKGSKVTKDIGKKLTGGGKSGGFLKTIADGVAKFGNNKVIKGAASLALLGGAIALTAIGLKQFNEVDFTSIIKGTIAVGGLAMLAQTLGKGSTAMMKGAAAIALLGLSVVPLAFGLRLMNDVGAGTLFVLAGGLTVLGIAGAVIGSFLPLMLMGAVGIAALGAAIIPFAIAMKIMDGVGMATIGTMASGMTALGLAAIGFGLAMPFILLGSVAMAALGIALIPLGLGLKIVSSALPSFVEAMDTMSSIDGKGMLSTAGGMVALAGAMALMAPLLPLILIGAMAAPALKYMGESLQAFNNVNFANLAMAGIGMKAIAEGMAAMSGGSLKSSMMDGIGSFFGADSPIDKLKTFVEGFESLNLDAIHLTADALSTLSDTLFDLSYSMSGAAPEFEKLAKAMDTISAGSLVKMAAIKAMGALGLGGISDGAVAQASAKPSTPAIVGTTVGGSMGQAPMDGGAGPGIFAPMGGTTNTPVTAAQNFMSASYGQDDDDFGDAITPTAKEMKKASTGPVDPEDEKDSMTIMAELMHRQLEVQQQQLAISKKQNRNIEGLEI